MSEQAQLDLLACPACAHQNLGDARYCNQCGIALRRDSAVIEDPRGQTGADGLHASFADRPTMDAPQLADPLLGIVVADRYRILELLGRGGMGVVYKVEHARIGKLMALKLLTGELTRDTALMARFQREALMASKLSHANTVQVFDYGSAEGLTYLAMEYLAGQDLSRPLKHGPISASRTTKIMIQVCSSLNEAHEHGIVHRDLKPENVFLLKGSSGDDIVKVLDFGLAKLRESSELAEVTTSGSVVGTPYYMSPEQVRGEAVDARSDIYSLGAVLYKCLTGNPPFDAQTPMGILTLHLTEEPVPPCDAFPRLSIPREMSDVVMKALAKDPNQRFQTVRELQRALVEAIRGAGHSMDSLLDSEGSRRVAEAVRDAAAREVATRDEVDSYERKLRRRGLFAIAGIVVGLGAGVFVGWRAWQRATAEPTFDGREREPNSQASDAMTVPFGEAVRGKIGKRLDEARGDRDFYRIDVPDGTEMVRISTSSLPNMALCTWLYRSGVEEPQARYCTGASARSLDVPALRLDAGQYLFAIIQDRDQYTEDPPPPVHENVSDEYELRVTAGTQDASIEVEPNDTVQIANSLNVKGTLRGKLAWMRDADTICASATSGKIQFAVEDSLRARYSVLQVTPYGGPADQIPVRVHHASSKVKASPRDVKGAWKSPVVELGGVTEKACVSLRLVPNPWAPTPHPRVAPAGAEEYTVRVEPAD